MNKNIGLFGVLIALLSVACLTFLLLQKSPSNLPRRVAPKASLAIPSFNPADLNKFRQHELQLNRELSSQNVVFDADAMKIFGYQEKPFENSPLMSEKKVYHVAMIYSSGKHNYVLIDDKLYKRGDTLPNGEFVRKIKLSGVVVEKDGKSSLLTINDVNAAPIVGQKARGQNKQTESYQNVINAQRQVEAIKKSLKMLQNSSNRIN